MKFAIHIDGKTFIETEWGDEKYFEHKPLI